mmetsp:Transcript_19961/g.17639  ORF Transcript_19961/g.17639 Transcript_19961/m.17639 type:complete len:84 (+) Transcript_19961:177-428(+)
MVRKGNTFGISQKGFISIKPDKPNQDCYFIYENHINDILVMGVFDGHGKYGHEVSEFVKDFFEKFAQETKIIDSSAFQEAFSA